VTGRLARLAGGSVTAVYEAGSEPSARAGSDADPQRWTRGWRRIALASGMLVYPVVTAVSLSQRMHGAAAVAGYAIVGAFCCCYVLRGFPFARRGGLPSWLLLSAMTVLFVAALPFAQSDAFYLAAVVVSIAAAAVKRYAAWFVGAGVLSSLVVPWAVRPWHDGPGGIQALTILFTALMVYSTFENTEAYRALYEARAEVARLASEAERSRIARDLHDLLGHSLTAITVKSGLARRLAATGSPLYLAEITEVERLSRQALADVRAAVSDFREVTLVGELARGRELLRSLGVAAVLPTATDMVDGAHQELFGWAVREGLTNVARHARATRCWVTVSAGHVEIRDDGAGSPGPACAGNGLTGLRERAEALGARVEAGPAGVQGWRLRVSVGAGSGSRGPATPGTRAPAGAKTRASGGAGRGGPPPQERGGPQKDDPGAGESGEGGGS
jgi:two-component system sensor histidine kinase DesK